jgi:hypothetical protein
MNRPVLAIIAPCSVLFETMAGTSIRLSNRTKKHCLTKATPNLQNLTHTTQN